MRNHKEKNSNNLILTLSIIMVFSLIFSACFFDRKPPKVVYDKKNHLLIDESKNTIRDVYVFELNDFGIVANSMNIHKKLNNKGSNFICLQKVDTSVYKEIKNATNFQFKKGNSYTAIVDFLGYSDTIKFKW